MTKPGSKSTTAPITPTIEIVKPSSLTTFTVGPGDPVAAETQIGLWDHAARRVGVDRRDFLNEEEEPRNLVGGDSRRFYIRVTDPNAKGRKFLEDHVEWWTSFDPDDARSNTEDDPRSKLSLFEVGTATGVFVSKALMIVNDATDRDVLINSGVPKGHPLFAKHGGDRRDTQSNYRFRRGGMFSWVVASYLAKGAKTAVKSAVTPVFAKDRAKALPVHVYIVRKTVGGPLSVDPATVFATDLRVLTETYERIGLWTYTAVSALDAANKNVEVITARSGRPFRACVIDPVRFFDPSRVGDEGMRLQAKAFPGEPDTLRLFYIDHFNGSPLLGLSFGPTYVPPSGSLFGRIATAPEKVGASFIAGALRDPYTAAHELGHILTNKTTNGGHYAEPPAPTPLLQELNLMFPFMSGAVERHDQTKRIWDVFEPGGTAAVPTTQMQSILGSPFTR